MYIFQFGFDLINILCYVVEQLCVINAVKHSSEHISPLVDGHVGNERIDDILSLVSGISD
ncbi:hypothetical protein L195_g063275, partial [Trifolium pratense]